MERCPCHKNETTCPDAIGSSYLVDRKVMVATIALPAADAARGTFTRHPYAGGSRKPHQAKLKWRPRLTV